MFSHLIAYFTIFLGVLWVIWPKLLKGWMVGKASWTIFWGLFFLLFFPFISYASRWSVNGWLAAAVVFFLLGKFLRSLMAKAAEKIPLPFFRAAGALNIISGLAVLFLKK